MSTCRHPKLYFTIFLSYLFLEPIFLHRFLYRYFTGIITEIIFLIINIIPCIAIIIYILHNGESFEKYGFCLHHPIIQLLYAIGLFVFTGILFRSTAGSLSQIFNTFNNFLVAFNTINFFNLLDLFYNVLIEEIIWRGFILTLFTRKFNSYYSIIITSILFGLVHFPYSFSATHVLNTCISSIIYCYLRIHSPEKFSVFSLTITHFLWDILFR